MGDPRKKIISDDAKIEKEKVENQKIDQMSEFRKNQNVTLINN